MPKPTRKTKTPHSEQPGQRQQPQKSLDEIKKLQKRKPYRIVKAISESTDRFKTGRYESPADPGDDSI